MQLDFTTVPRFNDTKSGFSICALRFTRTNRTDYIWRWTFDDLKAQDIKMLASS